MRLLLVSNLLYPDGVGGAEKYVFDLANTLGRNHEVRVFTGSPGGEGVVTTRAYKNVRHDVSRSLKAAWHLRDQWHPRVALDLWRTIRSFEPDLVHSHEVQGLSGSVFTAIARSRTPHIHTAHDFNLFCMRTTMSSREGLACDGICLPCKFQAAVRMRAIEARLDWLIAPSRFVLDRHLAHLRISALRASHIPQGASSSSFRLRGESDRIVLGFLGSLAPHKGVLTLMRVFRKTRLGELHIAGSGPLERDVRAAADAERRIRFWGRVDGHRKEEFFDAIDVLVIPSEWEENAPLVAVEAAVRGIPSVVTPRGGLPETPEAFVAQATGEAALLGAIERCLNVGDVKSASRRLLDQRETFSWATHVKRVASVMSSVVDESKLVRS